MQVVNLYGEKYLLQSVAKLKEELRYASSLSRGELKNMTLAKIVTSIQELEFQLKVSRKINTKMNKVKLVKVSDPSFEIEVEEMIKALLH